MNSKSRQVRRFLIFPRLFSDRWRWFEFVKLNQTGITTIYSTGYVKTEWTTLSLTRRDGVMVREIECPSAVETNGMTKCDAIKLFGFLFVMCVVIMLPFIGKVLK